MVSRMNGTAPSGGNDRGPAGFNLYTWLIDVVSDLFNLRYNREESQLVATVRAWITNPNTDIASARAGNVGLRYWLLSFVRCHFPDDLDCSGGIGLEPAILWVSLGFLGAYV